MATTEATRTAQCSNEPGRDGGKSGKATSRARTLHQVWLSWRTATERALYGDGGFYRRSERPAAHFRTSVHASPRFAAALLTLLGDIDTALGQPTVLDLIDVGAGDGELLCQLLALMPHELADRLRPVAVEVRARPPELPTAVEWWRTPPRGSTGLVVANEWLDNIPVDVVELDSHGRPRLVFVDPATGAERLGDRPDPADQAWLDRWWPLTSVGDRAEIGRPRDTAWAELLSRLRQGVALAIDYGHELPDRPRHGTLAGYRRGRPVRPVPDGSCDICAHVALDACAAAGPPATTGGTVLTTQRDALRSLGLDGHRPPLRLAGSDPPGYLRRLRQAGEEGELLDPTGLGGFGWLVYSVGACPLPFKGATMA